MLKLTEIPCISQRNITEPYRLYQITNFTDQYVNLVVSIVGTIFNSFSLTVLLDRDLKHNFYDFFRCRCVSNLVVCLIGIAYGVYGGLKLCRSDYMDMAVSLYALLIPIRITIFASAICDNLLILNRLVNLHDKKGSIFFKLSKKVTI
jgi:hypothetical protein